MATIRTRAARALLAVMGMASVPLACAQSTPAAPATPPAPANNAAPCSDAAHRQFDFWVGEWNVTNPNGKPAGHSRIEAILGSCVVLEQWTSATPPSEGKSFNLYNAQTRQWEQFWVDNGGTRLHLAGGLVDGKMILSGQQDVANAKTGMTQRERITWTPNADGSVRQLWETSNDDGKTWVASFDGLYRRVDGSTGDNDQPDGG